MNELDGDTERDRAPAGRWLIGGRVYLNSAAAFWQRLMDELINRFPGCNRAVMLTQSGGRIHPGLLTPEADLAAALESDRDLEQVAEELRELTARLQLTGPGRVELTAFRDEECLGGFPDLVEAVDSEIFLFLVSWLLRWSEVPAVEWDGKVVESDFAALDPYTGRRYQCSFACRNRHLSEGLRERTVVLVFQRWDSGET